MPHEARFSEYPEDGPLPGIEARVVHDERPLPEQLVDEETAAFEEHPALANRASAADDRFVFLEALGLTDATSDSLGAHTFEGAALINLLPVGRRPPDVTLHRGSRPVGEYNNHEYFPGLFPTLFPLGIGGIEDHESQTHRVGFRTHASYLLDLADRSFAYHRSFVFMVVNILQRRKVHLETRFRVKTSRVAQLAAQLESVTADQIRHVGTHLSTRGSYDGLSADDNGVLELLKIVEAVAAKVPGGHATKIALRRNIYSFMRHFGVPHVFLTLNPGPVHSPLFQLMYGDTTIDLSSRYPRVLDSITRSLRVAQDPAAAADFFDLSIRLIFEHLLGWDFDNDRSSSRGGVLGHIECFAGSVEMTGRHIAHGHFVIRLRGGLNPVEFHQRMDRDAEFQTRFFEMFEGMIRHHLPDVFYEPDPTVNPKQQRPPRPPEFVHDFITPASGSSAMPRLSRDQMEELDDWEREFESEVKLVGETTQRHAHKKVCKAYGFKGECLFLFPHEVVETSSYDSASKSVVMQCLDPLVNYFNPEILVSCRFHHDIKNILSGKSAQEAVCYIAGYITKQDVNTQQVLNMMSDAVMNLEQRPPVEGQRVPVQTLIHKCLAQLTRNQTLHAQRAVRYIRGRDDFFLSHRMVSLMSGMLMQYVRRAHSIANTHPTEDNSIESPDESDDDVRPSASQTLDDDDEQDPFVQLVPEPDGSIRFTNQVEDYVYRDPALSSYNFYDFVRMFCVVSLREAPAVSFKFRGGHSRVATHCMRYRDTAGSGNRRKEYVPTFVGCSVPRKSDTDSYKLFCLAHFKPFGLGVPLLPAGRDVAHVFKSYRFSRDALRRMGNWEAIFECEDERDADRLRRQSKKGSSHGTLPLFGAQQADADGGFVIDPANIPEQGYHAESFDFWSSLQYAGWFSHRVASGSNPVAPLVRHDIADHVLKERWKGWRVQLREQEQAVRSGGEGPVQPVPPGNDAQTELGAPCVPTSHAEPRTTARERVVPKLTMEYAESFAVRYTLNAEQLRAYRLIVRSLIVRLEPTHDRDPASRDGAESAGVLRLILHGPGGTGKTHCLKPLQDLLDAVNMRDAIVRVAPTGTAASLIDGMTLHSALKLKIKRGMGSGDTEVLEVDWNAADRKHLEAVFGPAHIIVLDEFSMASPKLLAQLDAGTRLAKQNFDEFFGGMSVVLSGDLCQYAPVMEKAVYCPVSNNASKNVQKVTLNRMGRLAYKSFQTVIEFSEQQRMSSDPQFAAAVNRLRIRQCVHSDVVLFNTRVMRSAKRPGGVDMSTPEMSTACVIAATNRTRVQINAAKTKSLGGSLPSYVEISASDALRGSTGMRMSASLRSRLLDVQLPPTQLPGRLNYYTGMPVIMRRRNLSVGLRATNGAQGTLRQVIHAVDEFGENIPRLALVDLPDSEVHLAGLESGVFPVAPQTTSLSAVMKDTATSSEDRFTVSRSQFALEPAFCITGHIAQGRTLPKVVADPATRRSGFYSYVSISRARCLGDIVFVRDICLEDLNEPLPQALRFELQRLGILAHNTAVMCGDLDAPLKVVPVHEMERSGGSRIRLVDSGSSASGSGRKHAYLDDTPVGSDAALDLPLSKRRRRTVRRTERDTALRNGQRNTVLALNRQAAARRAVSGVDQSGGTVSEAQTVRASAPQVQGPVWDSEYWSCAYDSAFMALWFAWKAMAEHVRGEWASFSYITAHLAQGFRSLDSQELGPLVQRVDGLRLRRLLVQADPVSFPPTPRSQADLFQLLQLCSRDASEIRMSDFAFDVEWTCRTCGGLLSEEELYLRSHIDSPDGSASFSLSLWLSRNLFVPLSDVPARLAACCTRPVATASVVRPPAILDFRVDALFCVTPCVQISIPTPTGECAYRLSGVIYATPSVPSHFSARLIQNNSVWLYDGQRASGSLRSDGSVTDDRDFGSHGANRACAFVYAPT